MEDDMGYYEGTTEYENKDEDSEFYRKLKN